MLPWLCFDFLTITIITLTFVTWAFLSFFVHVLLAILFPVIAGAILGLYIYLWRNVKDVFEMCGDEEMKTGKLIHVSTSGGLHYSTSKMYRKLPAAAASPQSVNSHPSVLSGNRHIAVTWCNYNNTYVISQIFELKGKKNTWTSSLDWLSKITKLQLRPCELTEYSVRTWQRLIDHKTYEMCILNCGLIDILWNYCLRVNKENTFLSWFAIAWR